MTSTIGPKSEKWQPHIPLMFKSLTRIFLRKYSAFFLHISLYECNYCVNNVSSMCNANTANEFVIKLQ